MVLFLVIQNGGSCHLGIDFPPYLGQQCAEFGIWKYIGHNTLWPITGNRGPQIFLTPFLFQYCFHYISPSRPLDTVRVMMTVWRIRGNIIRTALCWIVSQSSQSAAHLYEQFLQVQQIGFVTLGPYVMCSGGCLELYYCNMMEWFWWDSSLISMPNWFNRPRNDTNQPNNQPT